MLLSTIDGTILDANPEACEMLRGTRKEMIGARQDDIFDLADPRRASAFEKLGRTTIKDSEGQTVLDVSGTLNKGGNHQAHHEKT